MAEKMELQGQRKSRVAIKDEGRRKECTTATETITSSEKPQLDEMFHGFSSRSTQNKSAVEAEGTQHNWKTRSKDVSTCRKKIAIQTCNGQDTSSSTPSQSSTPPSAVRGSNKKHQTKKTVSSVSKGAKTSFENAVPAENSSAKSLKVCDNCSQCNSEEVCFPETNQNAEPSSVKDDTTQQNKKDDHKITLLSGKEEPYLSSLKSPKRPNCPPEDESFIVENGKKKRKSDYRQPEDYKVSETGSGLEDRENNQSNCEGNEIKPHVNLSFKPEQMREKSICTTGVSKPGPKLLLVLVEDQETALDVPSMPYTAALQSAAQRTTNSWKIMHRFITHWLQTELSVFSGSHYS
ncbi:hypothetical protein G5714_018834 [Onychostoma macrolepis]|uniref:Uncharacterized protein n=1 Tax=Onychostoma macrolepis TaxID=369639 RepID=A0A7J6C031_9TELE|nr:hypothetical protein G5714_018834 [Onychostoma macrolepis]